MKGLDVKADGKIYGFKKICFDPNIDMRGLTWGAATTGESMTTGGSPAVVDVWLADFFAKYKYPYVRELPQAFFDVMVADLTGRDACGAAAAPESARNRAGDCGGARSAPPRLYTTGEHASAFNGS